MTVWRSGLMESYQGNADWLFLFPVNIQLKLRLRGCLELQPLKGN